MKLYQLYLLIILFTTGSVISMELQPQLRLDHLSNSILAYIAVLAKNQKSLYLTNKTLSTKITKNNFLIRCPHYLKRKDHIDLMVKYAKRTNYVMMKLALTHANLCNHADVMKIIYYFTSAHCPIDAKLLKTVTLYKQASHKDPHINNLTRPIMDIYKGDDDAIDAYKNKYIYDEKKRNTLSALQIAVGKNHIHMTEILLAQAEKTIVQPESGSTDLMPLVIATVKQHMDIIKILAKHPYTDINAQTINGITALSAAVSIGNHAIARYLIKKKANINLPDHNCATPLYRATEKEDPTMVELLLVNGANPNIPANNKTPLMLAALYNNKKIVLLLLKYGADATMTNAKKQKAYDFTNNNKIKQILTNGEMCILF